MNDDDSVYNSWAIRTGMFILALFCASAFQSCQELRYSFGGKSVLTRVDNVTEQRGRYGELEGYTVWYDVPDANMRGFSHVGIDQFQSFPIGLPIVVEYIGKGTSHFDARLKGSGKKFWVVLFFTFLAVLVVGAVWGFIYSARSLREDKLGSKRRR
ncbi:MAG: hypothetical protein K8T25_06425 [Planctomycetia bacterium]|nr:hypothetical protein [Planctomycetia bacterium]